MRDHGYHKLGGGHMRDHGYHKLGGGHMRDHGSHKLGGVTYERPWVSQARWGDI